MTRRWHWIRMSKPVESANEQYCYSRVQRSPFINETLEGAQIKALRDSRNECRSKQRRGYIGADYGPHSTPEQS